MVHWETIRASWVNGQRTQAKEQLYQQSKRAMLWAILEAVESFYEYWDPESGTFSEDLQDLREILRSFDNRR